MTEPDSRTTREKLISRLGGYSTPLLWYRALRPRWLWRITSPFGKPVSRYVEENGFEVKRGPFAGTRYPKSSPGRVNYLASKLAGAYEPPVIQFLSDHAREADVFVDLGSSDGFFLAGVGRLSGSVRVIGFEVNRFERSASRKLAGANGVNAEVREYADHQGLNELPAGKLLLLCDLEGFERTILDPVEVPRLSEATMIVETHPQFVPDVETTLESRFRETHEIVRHEAAVAAIEDYPELKEWETGEARKALSDAHRSGDGWLAFIPK